MIFILSLGSSPGKKLVELFHFQARAFPSLALIYYEPEVEAEAVELEPRLVPALGGILKDE